MSLDARNYIFALLYLCIIQYAHTRQSWMVRTGCRSEARPAGRDRLSFNPELKSRCALARARLLEVLLKAKNKNP